MNLIDDDKLAAAIKTALADAQARGVALEDHEAELLTTVLHGALLEASSDVAGILAEFQKALAPAVCVLGELNTQLFVISREWFAWRQMLERINLSPEKVPK